MPQCLSSKPLYVSFVKTMRQELSVPVAVENGKGKGMNSSGGSQGRSEVKWERDDRSHLRMRYILLLCFSCQKKKERKKNAPAALYSD